MLRSLEELEFVKGKANSLEIYLGSQGKMIHPVCYANPFQATGRVDSHETVVALSSDCLRRRLGQRGVALERLVKRLHFPPFLVDRFDGLAFTVQVAASQIQRPGAAISVLKDLAKQQDRKVQSPQPAAHRLTFRQVQRVYPVKATLKFRFIAQCCRPVGFERDNELLAQALVYETQILFGRKPAVCQNIAILQPVLLTDLQHPAHQFILGNLAPALEPAGVLILEHHRLADDFVCHRQRHTLSVVNAVEDVDALERSVLAVIEVPTDDLVLVRMGLFLDGVVKYERAIGLFHLSHHGLDLLPEGPGVVDILGQEAGYPVMADFPFQHVGQAGGGRRSKGTQQVIAVEFGQFFVHGSKIAAFFSLCVRSVSNEDMYVRKLAIASLGSLAEASPKVAIDLAKNVELGDSEVLASELCRLFYGGWGLPFGELTADDLKVLLSKLEDVQNIEDSYINTFLVKASELDAVSVAGFLLDRIRKEHNGKSRYDALPILGFRDPLVGLGTSPDQEKMLRNIRDASLEQGRSGGRWIPQLFLEISPGFESATSLKVLGEWADSGNDDKIKAAARLVSGARPGFVFQHVEFVSNLLERAYAASDDTYQAVSSTLASIALSGIRSGTPGQPMPEDVATRDQAAAVANTFDAGSPTYRFYDSLARSADASIRYHMQRDEELFE